MLAISQAHEGQPKTKGPQLLCVRKQKIGEGIDAWETAVAARYTGPNWGSDDVEAFINACDKGDETGETVKFIELEEYPKFGPR